ncbi:MAG TPA: ParD-like family protein [Advenella sp.]|nr:ParD-like family protein [Advenella sp.]
MGIVKISDQMHENLRLASTALSRSINAQAEHWMRIGMLAEMYPDLDHSDLCRLLVQAGQGGALDLNAISAMGDAAIRAGAPAGARQ